VYEWLERKNSDGSRRKRNAEDKKAKNSFMNGIAILITDSSCYIVSGACM
jgi:hypothetical protein